MRDECCAAITFVINWGGSYRKRGWKFINLEIELKVKDTPCLS